MSQISFPLAFTVFKGSPAKEVVQTTTTRNDLEKDEVLIKISHSGVCGSDRTLLAEGFPIVLGHEGIGTVVQAGSTVKEIRVGDRVGWGYQQHACGHCNQCGSGNETYCPERILFGFGNKDVGSFGEYMIIEASWTLKIPDSTSSVEAGPLMCGGPTVFNPLFYNVKSTDRVAVIGIGGLGHLALQFARAFGTYVIAFASERKKEEALSLGANEVVVMRAGATPKVKGGLIDHLIVTTGTQPDFEPYYPLLNSRATLYPLGVWMNDDIRVKSTEVLMKGLRVQGSLVANRLVHRTMLDFAARHDVRPVVQEFPMTLEGINAAFQAMDKGDLRFRAVLVAKE